MSLPKRIGIVGGLGPAAASIYRHALQAEADRLGCTVDVFEEVADNEEMLQAAGDGDLAAVASAVSQPLYNLKRRGAQVVAIAAVTPHMAAAALRDLVDGCDFVDIVDVLNAELKRRRLHVVGLLGTRATVGSGVFGRLATGTVPLTGGRLARIHDLYVSIVARRAVPAGVAEELLRAAIDQIDDGAEAIVLAGTELSLIPTRSWDATPVVDCSRLHVDAIIAAACGRDPRVRSDLPPVFASN